MKKMFLGLLVGGLALASSASPALAAGPATVTVRVEGSSGALLPPTTVTTTTTPVVKDGTHGCSGTSAAGALELATGGDWSGTYDSGFGTYAAERIKNADYGAFSSTAPYFWSFVVDGAAADGGICATELQAGDEVLFYTGCNAASTGCYGFGAPVVQATAPATVAPGQPFTVTAKTVTTSFDNDPPYAKHVSEAPVAAADVRAGAATATTDAAGSASLTLADRGPATLRVTHGASDVPYERVVCVTDGHDGFCGTTAPGTTSSTPGTVAAPCATSGDDGRCGSPDKRAAYGFIGSVKEGKHYAKGSGPRELSGRVDDEPAGIEDIQLRLTRNDHARCATYDATRERFVRIKRCGAPRGRWFSVGDRADWTYLLPAKLGRGRYVLDVRVTDKAGNRDATLARGRNRVVFFVA
jgi:hypothetical protein